MLSTTRLVSLALILVASGCSKETAPADAPPEATPTAAKAVAQAPAKADTTTEPASDCAKAAAKAGVEDTYDCTQKSDEGAGGCNKWDAEAAAVLERGVPKDASWKTYAVTGMTCGGCERKVIAKLGTIDGVLGVEADAELGQVRVATAKNAASTVKEARTALNGLYKITGDI